MAKIQPNRQIPSKLAIKGFDNLLYEIGLCPTSVIERPKPRKLLNNPGVICIILWIQFIERFLSIVVEEPSYLLLLGDIGRYYGIKFYWNILNCFSIAIPISSQILYSP